MKVLVLYSTVEGQTQKIAETIASQCEELGFEVFLAKASGLPYCDPGTVDAAFFCAPIHIGNYPSDFVHYIQNWKSAMNDIATALVTVSLAIASDNKDEREEAEAYPQKLFEKTGWHTEHLHNAAGALKYLEYDFFKRWMMKRIAKSEGGPIDTTKDHELTDWNALGAFVTGFTGQIKSCK